MCPCTRLEDSIQAHFAYMMTCYAPPHLNFASSGRGVLACRVQYILRTDNPEKVPDLATCRAGSASPACGPGFFDAAPADSRPARRQRSSSHRALQSLWPQGGGQLPPAEVDSTDRADGQLNVASQPHACCDGFFCPAALTCMMPCPLGAICSRWGAASTGTLQTTCSRVENARAQSYMPNFLCWTSSAV